jgi:sugar-specific transcriptional regulator TrmB
MKDPAAHIDNSPATEGPDFSILGRLGLAKTEIVSYEALYLQGPRTAGELAKSIKRPRTSVYHALDRLIRSGFVERDKVEIFHQPSRFSAIRLDKALENLAIYQRRAVRELVDYQIGRSIRQQAGLNTSVQRKDWR